MRISDIYAGKPDAGDEIRECGYDEFVNIFIRPTGVNIDRLASTVYGTPFFIMGDKGTGKTALLYYLEKYVCELDEAACTSFIYFESGFTQIQREKFKSISQSLATSVSIDSTITTIGKSVECDFSYIWRWQIYQKIIDDNERFNGGLFVDDKYWDEFVSEVGKIRKTIAKERMIIPAKISVTATTDPHMGTVTPGIQLEPIDLSQSNFQQSKSYVEFVRIIDNADRLVRMITRTDIPYYIFIDELEAYRGESEAFYRDLRMIRDLLFTVKIMNDIFRSGTKVICSVRLEILNSINRFIETKQLHKIMQGYDERLTWEYTNTNSFSHPIIGVLLRRIQNAEEKHNGCAPTNEEIIKKWFVSNVYNTHICTYILDNTWHKPRDIVRMLLSAQAKNSRDFSVFNQNTFETFMPVYSKQCLVEVREEMRALYTAEEIENIFNCLQGFKVMFTFDEIEARAKRLCPNSIFAKETFTVLSDMYRIGVVGNYLSKDQAPKWEYKEQYKLMIDAPWKIIIHPSLRIELSVNSKMDRHIAKIMQKQQTDAVPKSLPKKRVYSATVEEIRQRYILVSFEMDGEEQSGYISMRKLGIKDLKEGELDTCFSVGETIHAEVTGYNEDFGNWYMRVLW